MFEVCLDHGAGAPERCLTLWTLFGGVPKYWRHFAETDGLDAIPEWEPWAHQVCERLFLHADSPLREEGETLLARELHRNYLAILRTVAERRSCTHGEIQDALPELTSLGPYLTTLTHDLRLLEKQLPMFARSAPAASALRRVRRVPRRVAQRDAAGVPGCAHPARLSSCGALVAATRDARGACVRAPGAGRERGSIPRRRWGLSDDRSRSGILEPTSANSGNHRDRLGRVE